jgi:hypothetical protein
MARHGPAAHGRLKATTILLNDAGRQNDPVNAERLLAEADVKQLVTLGAPRPVRFVEPSARAKEELAGLGVVYTLLGNNFDPLR